MSDNPHVKQPFFHSPLGLLVAGTILAVLSTIAWALLVSLGGADALAKEWQIQPGQAALAWWLLTLLVFIGSILAIAYFLIGVIRWAVYGAQGTPAVKAEDYIEEMLRLLRSIDERSLISDTAKRLAYRDRDRETLRKAIREDIARHDFEAALALVTEMSQVYGYRQEAEDFREEIVRAREAETAHKITQTVARFEGMLDRHDWDAAASEAAKIQRLYPDSPQVRDLVKRVREVREQHKHDLERQFLQASERDDVEKAMELLKELDKYLTEAEAAPFLETARGVIGKKRQNLGVQFKLAVHDKEWTQAVKVGEQIIREFPNSKMADEVRRLLDLLRERAAGEQAARPREMA